MSHFGDTHILIFIWSTLIYSFYNLHIYLYMYYMSLCRLELLKMICLNGTWISPECGKGTSRKFRLLAGLIWAVLQKNLAGRWTSRMTRPDQLAAKHHGALCWWGRKQFGDVLESLAMFAGCMVCFDWCLAVKGMSNYVEKTWPSCLQRRSFQNAASNCHSKTCMGNLCAISSFSHLALSKFCSLKFWMKYVTVCWALLTNF